jgi:hypothetical protein
MCSELGAKSLALALAAGLLLVLACGDMVLFRAKGDFFPLVPGTRWTYALDGTTTIDSVAGDTSVAGRACVAVLRNYSPEFWTRQQGEARRFVRRTVNRAGHEYLLEERYGLAYVLPFVLGSNWSESFRDTVPLSGTDTVFVKDSIFGRVAAIEDVQTQAGTFIQCYRLELHQEVAAADTTVSDWTEWLAPGVGLVKSVAGTTEKSLVEFKPGP